MIEHTGTAYLPQMDEMKHGISSYWPLWNRGKIALSPLYLKAGCLDTDDGEVYCDTMAIQSMEVSDTLLLSKFPSLEVGEEGDGHPHPLDIATASEIDDVFEELMQTSIDAISDEDYQLKRKNHL